MNSTMFKTTIHMTPNQIKDAIAFYMNQHKVSPFKIISSDIQFDVRSPQGDRPGDVLLPSLEGATVTPKVND